MASRGDLAGNGPSSGLYKPAPTPPEADDLSVYVNDELLILGGIINGILEGGAFPPQGKLPQRWKEGSMLYFIQPLEDTYVGGDLDGQTIITSAGIWLYKRARWWKVIDDPSDIQGLLTVYKLGDGNVPDTPPTGPDYPPVGWSTTAPQKNDKGEYIWASQLVQKQNEVDYVWSSPTIWSGGVEDGVDGSEGEAGLRGTLNLLDPVSRTSWDDQAAYDLIVATTSSEAAAKNRVPLGNDVVTQQENGGSFVESRAYTANSGNPGTWVVQAMVVDGNLIATGTIGGSSINANTKITVGGNAGQDVVILDASDPDARIWVGNVNQGSANFKVDPSGNMTTNNVTVNGGVFKIPSSANTNSGFYVDSAGNLYAQTGSFRGEVFAENINGKLYSTYRVNTRSAGYSASNKLVLDVNIPKDPNSDLVVQVSGFEGYATGSGQKSFINYSLGGAANTFQEFASGAAQEVRTPFFILGDTIPQGTGTQNLKITITNTSGIQIYSTPLVITTFWDSGQLTNLAP